MRQTFKTATLILGVLRRFHKRMLEGEDFFLIVLPRLPRATMSGYLCLDLSKPIRDDVPGSFGKNRTLPRLFPDLLSNHTTAIEEERCQANAEEHPEQRQHRNLCHA